MRLSIALCRRSLLTVDSVDFLRVASSFVSPLDWAVFFWFTWLFARVSHLSRCMSRYLQCRTGLIAYGERNMRGFALVYFNSPLRSVVSLIDGGLEFHWCYRWIFTYCLYCCCHQQRERLLCCLMSCVRLCTSDIWRVRSTPLITMYPTLCSRAYVVIFIPDDYKRQGHLNRGSICTSYRSVFWEVTISVILSKKRSVYVYVSYSELVQRYNISLVQYTVHCTDEQHAMSSHELRSALMLTVEFSKIAG
jgi:hypothetical protein